MKLLVAHTTNTAGDSFEIHSFGNRRENHLYTVYVWGTFGAGTVTIEASPDNVEFFPVPDLDAITAKTITNMEVRAPFLRASVAGGTAASINVTAL